MVVMSQPQGCDPPPCVLPWEVLGCKLKVVKVLGCLVEELEVLMFRFVLV